MEVCTNCQESHEGECPVPKPHHFVFRVGPSGVPHQQLASETKNVAALHKLVAAKKLGKRRTPDDSDSYRLLADGARLNAGDVIYVGGKLTKEARVNDDDADGAGDRRRVQTQGGQGNRGQGGGNTVHMRNNYGVGQLNRHEWNVFLNQVATDRDIPSEGAKKIGLTRQQILHLNAMNPQKRLEALPAMVKGISPEMYGLFLCVVVDFFCFFVLCCLFVLWFVLGDCI